MSFPGLGYVTDLCSALGITEIQIIQWYVEEGAHIEEWKPLCQYQSDKAVDDVSRLNPYLLCC